MSASFLNAWNTIAERTMLKRSGASDSIDIIAKTGYNTTYVVQHMLYYQKGEVPCQENLCSQERILSMQD